MYCDAYRQQIYAINNSIQLQKTYFTTHYVKYYISDVALKLRFVILPYSIFYFDE
jgi:hypothetical protein